jgi:hypothetical protein
MSDKVTIYKEKLATVLAYLAAHIPEGKRDHDEWFQCVQILAARREESEAQTAASTLLPDNVALRQHRSCLGCVFNDGCYRRETAATCERFIRSTADNAAGKCGDCELRGNCAEDETPGGCPRYVAKKWQGHKAAPLLSLCVDCIYSGKCHKLGNDIRCCDAYTPDAAQTLTTNATPPPQYDPATVAFPPMATRLEVEALREEVASLLGEISQLDEDHVDLLKCYIHHLREHMPGALRNAGEDAERDEKLNDPNYDPMTIAGPAYITAQQLADTMSMHVDGAGHIARWAVDLRLDDVREEIKAAIAKAIAAHEIATAEHFQGQIDTLSRVVDEDRKAVVAHERELHPDAPCVRLARVIASAPKDEPKTCPTCHHHAVCDKPTAPSTGCESWEGEHPK